MINLIVATDEKGLIGNGDKLAWHLPEDLKFFKEKTIGHSILMGRTTFEGMPGVLPKRETIVLTSNKNYDNEKVVVANDFDQLINEFKNSDKELWISGGAKVYEQSFAHVDKMFISKIPGEFVGDVYFPDFSKHNFKLEEVIDKGKFKVEVYVKND